ncbi:uncharacterized protein LOC115999167 [Ipomoea triloba]|uniref:uncharacterized protein LOC115999167 n=1 Tax=Ipomoea triloba TaxID=35885 RepID=UPI00125E3254|nr:uncharacterized protein LOC115999167 [Ipomoea triloba]XP_031094831.1 uncharacterized protein LOC115999167 [Ipomoea triloba]
MTEQVCSMEDAVLALLDHFVQPFLSRYQTRQAPTPSQHQTIAKQLHAVVLLYNYYHRKQHHELEFLDFISFSKLAVVLKPTLVAYMNLMRQADYSKMDGFENELSQTEKAIVNACSVSSALDASKTVPIVDGWPVSKVAIFLVNLRKENCMLIDSSITHGVWSVIEKDVEVSSANADNPLESKCKSKQKGAAETFLEDQEINSNDARLLDLALLAVKDATGINKSDLVVLESHVIYSLNKPKAAARLYVMQCTQSINDDIQVPIKDLIESLQGPIVKRSSYGWMVTPHAMYFHMFPYLEALLYWISREGSSHDSNAVSPQGENEGQNQNPVKVYHRLKNMLPLQEGHRWISPSIFLTKEETGESVLKSCDAGSNNDTVGTTSSMNGCSFSMANPLSQTKHRERPQTSSTSESQSALRILYLKRLELCEQQQIVEAEIMKCNRAIETVLHGGKSDLSSIGHMIEDPSDAYLEIEEIQESTSLTVEPQCKKLDELCREKKWPLPTYRVFPYADGFVANVIVKGGKYACQGSMSPSPPEAREMAAAFMIAKLGNMATSDM